MPSNIIEIGPTDNSRKWYKASAIWFASSIILSLLLVPFTSLEMYLNETCYTMWLGLLILPIFPLFVLSATHNRLNRIPTRIEMYGDRLRFVHYRGLNKFHVDLFWGDIVDIFPYEKIRDTKGREYSLDYLDKVCMNRILYYMEKPEKLTITEVEGLANLDIATQRMRIEPTGSLFIKGTTPSFLAEKVIWSVIIIPSFLFSLLILYWSLSAMSVAGIAVGGVISALLGLPVISYIIHVLRSMKEKWLEVDTKGARLLLKDGPLWDIEWEDMVKVSNRRERSTRYLDFHPMEGKSCDLSSNQFTSSDLKAAFKQAQEYCAYHRIRVVNTLGW